MQPIFEAEARCFESHRQQWIREGHLEQWVALRDHELLGFFRDPFEAWRTGVERWGAWDLFVKQVLHEDPEYRI